MPTLDDIAESGKTPQLRVLVNVLNSEFPELSVSMETIEGKTKLKVKDQAGYLLYTCNYYGCNYA